MGKQIIFYIERETEEAFVQFIFENGFQLVDYYFTSDDQPIIFRTIEDYRNAEHIVGPYLYRHEYGPLVTPRNSYNGRLFIQEMVSPVIEFSRSHVNHIDRRISQGRIWISTQWYDADGETVQQHPELMKYYTLFVRWLKKRIPYRETFRVARQRSNGETYDHVYKEYITDEMLALYKEGYTLG